MNDITALEERINALNETLKTITDDMAKVKEEAKAVVFDVSDSIANYTAKIKELDDEIVAKNVSINDLEAKVAQVKLDLENQVVSLNREKQILVRQERIDYLNTFIDSPPEDQVKYTREALQAKIDALNELRELEGSPTRNFREKINRISRQFRA